MIASRATILCLVMTISNLVVLVITSGQEIAWICLTTCSLDICGNCLVMFWLTLPRFRRTLQHATSAPISASREIRGGNSTKPYQLDTLFGLSATSSLATETTSAGGRIDIMSGRYPTRGLPKEDRHVSTGDVLGHLWRPGMNPRPSERGMSHMQDPEIESRSSLEEPTRCLDDIDHALTRHSLADNQS